MSRFENYDNDVPGQPNLQNIFNLPNLETEMEIVELIAYLKKKKKSFFKIITEICRT